MTTGSWVLLMLAAVITVGYGGYLLGRRNSKQQQEIDRLEQDLNAARQRADQIKTGVNTHFEQSAVIFGQLAKDYRQFLDHFQNSAKELGLSEGRAEELLDQVARPLLAHARETPAAAVVDAGSPSAQPETTAANSPEAPPDQPPAPSHETPEALAETAQPSAPAPSQATATGARAETKTAEEPASAGAGAAKSGR